MLQITSIFCRIQPTIVKPLAKATWKYTNPSSLATCGIYTQSDFDELRDHIMIPEEKPTILNSLAREITGHPTINQGISLTSLFNEDVIDKIAELIKLIADTIIHGYALHRLFGWSLHLLGAFWDSVTNLLLHLDTHRPSGPPAESHQKLLTASAPQISKEAP